MDNLTYTPKKLQLHNKSHSNIYNRSNSQSQNIEQLIKNDLDLNNQIIFPNLVSSINKNENNQSIINWNNISKNITDEPIKELDKKKTNKELQQNTITVETNNNDKIIVNRIKPTYIDESGWTHIVKSNKPKYKEKKKKNNIDNIDDLIKSVIKT
jgi:hypothetical protein